jgi:hypothetical protein
VNPNDTPLATLSPMPFEPATTQSTTSPRHKTGSLSFHSGGGPDEIRLPSVPLPTNSTTPAVASTKP